MTPLPETSPYFRHRHAAEPGPRATSQTGPSVSGIHLTPCVESSASPSRPALMAWCLTVGRLESRRAPLGLTVARTGLGAAPVACDRGIRRPSSRRRQGCRGALAERGSRRGQGRTPCRGRTLQTLRTAQRRRGMRADSARAVPNLSTAWPKSPLPALGRRSRSTRGPFRRLARRSGRRPLRPPDGRVTILSPGSVDRNPHIHDRLPGVPTWAA